MDIGPTAQEVAPRTPPTGSGLGIEATDDVGTRLGWTSYVVALLSRPEAGGAISAIVAFTIFAILARNTGFLGVAGAASWINVAAELGILSVPVGMLLIAGEFDLSVGSVAGATSVCIGLCSGYYGLSLWVGIAISVVVGVIVGVLNGMIVVKTGLPSFIVTLATLMMVYGGSLGISNILTQSTSLSITSGGFALSLFTASVDGFQVAILWWLGVALLGAYVLVRTKFGNWIYATGGNLETARNQGVATEFVRVVLFVCSALGGVLTGIVLTMTSNTGTPSEGSSYNLLAIAAVVIGGVLLKGGYGSVIGTMFGAITYGVVSIGVFYLGWDADLAEFFIGLFLLAAVLANNYSQRLVIGRR